MSFSFPLSNPSVSGCRSPSQSTLIDAQAAARHRPMESASDLNGAIEQLLSQQSGYWLAGKTTQIRPKELNLTYPYLVSVCSGRGHSTVLRLASLFGSRGPVHLQGSMVGCQSFVHLSPVCHDGVSRYNGLWYGQEPFPRCSLSSCARI